jgi:hypothetical protein
MIWVAWRRSGFYEEDWLGVDGRIRLGLLEGGKDR